MGSELRGTSCTLIFFSDFFFTTFLSVAIEISISRHDPFKSRRVTLGLLHGMVLSVVTMQEPEKSLKAGDKVTWNYEPTKRKLSAGPIRR
jgi:hypothetical protein